jgi:hypothetical protein
MKTLFRIALLFLFPLGAIAQVGMPVQQATNSRKILFSLASSTDHVTPITGASVTVTISKNGAAFAAPTGTVAEVGSGWYALTPSVADTGILGPLVLHATATSADPANTVANVVAYNPDDASALGLTAFAVTGPAATLTAIKADVLFAKLLNQRLAKYTYVPTTHVLTILGDDGTVFGTVTLSIDSNGNIISRQ